MLSSKLSQIHSIRSPFFIQHIITPESLTGFSRFFLHLPPRPSSRPEVFMLHLLHVSLPCYHCACSSVLWCFSSFVVCKEPSATALCITSFSRDFHLSHVKVSCNSIVLNRVLACCLGKEGRVSWSSWIRPEIWQFKNLAVCRLVLVL